MEKHEHIMIYLFFTTIDWGQEIPRSLSTRNAGLPFVNKGQITDCTTAGTL